MHDMQAFFVFNICINPYFYYFDDNNAIDDDDKAVPHSF